jgi:hypothetical protein
MGHFDACHERRRIVATNSDTCTCNKDHHSLHARWKLASAANAGSNAYLTKKVTAEKLLQTIALVMDGKG